MNGAEGYVGFILIGAAIAVLAFVLIRNEGWRALSNGHQRRRTPLVLGGLAALIGLGLIVVGLFGLVAT